VPPDAGPLVTSVKDETTGAAAKAVPVDDNSASDTATAAANQYRSQV